MAGDGRDVPWFDQNSFRSEWEWARPDPIPLCGDGLCALATALTVVCGHAIAPDALRDVLEAGLRDAYDGAHVASRDGTRWETVLPVAQNLFPVRFEAVRDVRQAQLAAFSGRRCVIVEASGPVFLTEAGERHPHMRHALCFHSSDSAADAFFASDSQICGGPSVKYGSSAFSKIILAGIDAGTCFSMSLADA